MNDYSVFDNKDLNNVYPMDNILLANNGIGYCCEDDQFEKYNILSQKYIFRRNTQIKDINNNDIFEYDLIEFQQKNHNKQFIFIGIVILRRGRFVIKNISFAGQKLYDDSYELSFNDLLSKYSDIRVLDNSLKLKEGQESIRNKFFFKIINKDTGEVIENCHIDNNCNVYHIVDISKKHTYSLQRNIKILLSTDVYDCNGDIIYYNDKVSFQHEGIDYFGTIEYLNGVYYIDSIYDLKNNKTDFKIPLYCKYTDNKLKNILIIKRPLS